MPSEMHLKLKTLAYLESGTMSGIIVNLIESHMANLPPKVLETIDLINSTTKD